MPPRTPRPAGSLLAHRVRRAVLRRRRLVTALLAGTAVVVAVRLVAPPPDPTAPMVVAARDLPAGVTLTAADLREVDAPPGVLPAQAATSAEPLVGRLLAGPMRRGEPFTDRRVVGPGLLAGYADGLVAAPVRLVDRDTAALLSVGDHVDVYAAGADPGDSADLVAADSAVLALPQPAEGGREGATVVLAVSPEQAARLAQAAATTALSLGIRR